MPARSEIRHAMEELNNVYYTSSEQHKNTTYALLNRDMKDIQIVLTYIKDRSPFSRKSKGLGRNHFERHDRQQCI